MCQSMESKSMDASEQQGCSGMDMRCARCLPLLFASVRGPAVFFHAAVLSDVSSGNDTGCHASWFLALTWQAEWGRAHCSRWPSQLLLPCTAHNFSISAPCGIVDRAGATSIPLQSRPSLRTPITRGCPITAQSRDVLSASDMDPYDRPRLAISGGPVTGIRG